MFDDIAIQAELDWPNAIMVLPDVSVVFTQHSRVKIPDVATEDKKLLICPVPPLKLDPYLPVVLYTGLAKTISNAILCSYYAKIALPLLRCGLKDEFPAAMPVAAVAVYVIAEGFAKLLLLVIVIVFAPAVEEGVYVNEAVGEAVVKLTVVGENAPPLLPSEGVTIVVPLIAPPVGVTLTVKLVEAVETVPLEGPESVIAVATGGAALTTRDMFEGFTRTTPLVATELLLDIEIATVAAALGV